MKTRKKCIFYLAATAVLLALFSPVRSYADTSGAPCVLSTLCSAHSGLDTSTIPGVSPDEGSRFCGN